MSLMHDIEELAAAEAPAFDRRRAVRAVNDLKFFLTHGQIRAAVREGGGWVSVPWVKQGILLGIRAGVLQDLPVARRLRFVERDSFPPRELTKDDGVQVAAAGTVIRDGAFVARGVVCLSPVSVEPGAYVDTGTVLEPHVLVGPCVQVGCRVRVGAGTQLGGALEPVSALPVILEDDVSIGGQCGVFGSTIIGAGAQIAPGVVIDGTKPLFDTVRRTILRAGDGAPLKIPPRAVVRQGTVPLGDAWSSKQGLGVLVPLIVAYRDGGAG
jgi:2,3,4,5-tetrahydropyridine-2-carboxylate N-succinyltransferase